MTKYVVDNLRFIHHIFEISSFQGKVCRLTLVWTFEIWYHEEAFIKRRQVIIVFYLISKNRGFDKNIFQDMIVKFSWNLTLAFDLKHWWRSRSLLRYLKASFDFLTVEEYFRCYYMRYNSAKFTFIDFHIAKIQRLKLTGKYETKFKLRHRNLDFWPKVTKFRQVSNPWGKQIHV